MKLIPEEEKGAFFKIVLGTAAMVIAYAILHDQYLIRVSPRHFTEYHPNIFPVSNLTLLAACFAITATFGPGLVLGYLMYAAARLGRKQKTEIAEVYLNVFFLIVVLEIIAVSIGLLAPLLAERGQLPFPGEWYPDKTKGILVTQTTQIVCYLLAPILSSIALIKIYKRRSQATVQVTDPPLPPERTH